MRAPLPVGLGRPRVHLRLTDSTNAQARRLAAGGVPHGTLVTATEQSAGRGRQGRHWVAAPGRAILCSVVIRQPPRLLPLAAGVAVAETAEEVASAGSGLAEARCLVKWPNDVLLGGRKVAGILVEGRPQEGWAVVGIGLNVAGGDDEFPSELRGLAGTLGLPPQAVEPTLGRLMGALNRWVSASPEDVLAAVGARDALRGQPVRWSAGQGQAEGLDADGRLVVVTQEGRVALEAGEVHLVRS
jgi:BirA family biotin operon repressor/biotin-[acetyl-CoA-carboxylase] ligase